jgi:hypothetical protein
MVANIKLRPIQVLLRLPMMSISRMLITLLVAVLCACTAPGKGVKAESGYDAAAPVIAALEDYRQSNHAYPQSLDLLVPKFLSGEKLIAKLAGGTKEPFKYRLTGTSYELSFSYTGPGTNQCVYRESAKAWQCYGAY